MDLLVELFGYIEHSCSNYDIEKCYNYGTVESENIVGGIVGGAFNSEGNVIKIRYCYNTGKIKCNKEINGGILGATYNFFDETVTNINKNIITCCYNIGEIESTSPNQISSKYARVTYSYYISDFENMSQYGTGKSIEDFKSNDSTSILKMMNRFFPNIWTINENNNGYLSLNWQNE